MTEYPTDREHLALWLNQHDLVGTMAEIGCAFGGYAAIVLRDWKGQRYIMVDPWIAQDVDVYRERQEEAWKYEQWFKECTALAQSDARISIIRMYSRDAATKVEDASLDCCYIDGNHSYEAVKEDIACWYPKVKSGGLFGGHDHYDSVTGGNWCYVKTAVEEWAQQHGISVHVSGCSSWWTIKR